MSAVTVATTAVDATHQKNKRTRGRGRPRKEVTQNDHHSGRPLPSPPLLPVSRRSSRRPRQQLREDFYNVDGIVVEDEEDEYVRRGQETEEEMDEEVMAVDEEEEEEEEDCKSKKKLKLLLKLSQNPQTKHKARSLRGPGSCSSDENASGRDRRNVEDTDEIRHHEDSSRRLGSNHTSSTSGSGTAIPLPDLKTLVLILDKIQKKDKYGVFSEPVDPEELPDYHEVIEHPMDFGTIRKKLTSNIYSNLEEFESDVLLVCSNAMQYNSPETIYFKQARCMQELAKKKFQTIRARSKNSEVILNSVQERRQNTASTPMKDRPTSLSEKCIENQEKLVLNMPNKDQPKSLPDKLVESQPKSPANKLIEDTPKPFVDNPIENQANSVADKFIEKSMCSSPKPLPVSADFHENNLISNGNVASEMKNTEYIGAETSENCFAFMATSVCHQGLSEKAEEPLEKTYPSGTGPKPTSVDEDRRSTYTKSKNQLTLQSNSLLSTFDSEKKLVAVGLHYESSYARSLARFSANLGPIAWRIASKNIEKSLPSGLKFGPGWVGDYEPPLTPIFSCENNIQQVSSSRKNTYHKASSENKYNCEHMKAKIDQILQNRHAVLTNGNHATELNCKSSSVVEGEIFGTNIAEGAQALFGFPLGHRPQVVNETLQHQRGMLADYSAKICTGSQAKTDVSTYTKSVTNHFGSPLPMYPGCSDVEASRCMDMGFRNSSNTISDEKSENSIPEVEKSSTRASNLPALQDDKHSFYQKLNGSVGFMPFSQPGNVCKSNPLAPTNQKVDDPVKLLRMLPGNVPNYPNSSLPNTGKQFISPVLSARNHSISASTSIVPSWIPARTSSEHESGRTNMDAHALMPATNSAEHASARTSDTSKVQTEAPISKPTWMFPHSTSGFEEVNNRRSLPQLTSRPNQESFRDQVFQNKSAVTFPKVLSSDLPKFHGQSPWQGFVQHSQQNQRHGMLPPDLNIGFQTPGSPGQQSSSILIESQQPDLALQL